MTFILARVAQEPGNAGVRRMGRSAGGRQRQGPLPPFLCLSVASSSHDRSAWATPALRPQEREQAGPGEGQGDQHNY